MMVIVPVYIVRKGNVHSPERTIAEKKDFPYTESRSNQNQKEKIMNKNLFDIILKASALGKGE
jgi:hypothetical protein